ncbi:DUF6232 family protein [Microseira wollei]|uniref:Uncharacterized protein n=1 Tax=Microseira wollei NIES-4236 TaxID=2530354 RepID=A0AAV3X880_9CYAN|nr:DUF6232 family protein [Microseira wollei]GET38603.1 hypothetical protein MiSe_33610 [Microseira wollei NIES-4236]
MTISSPEKFYENQEERIRITRTVLEYQGTDYPIRHIEKWSGKKDFESGNSPPIDIIPVGGLLLLVTWVLGQTTLILPELVLLGILPLLMTANDESAYKLIVTTDKGEEITLKASNKDELKKMKSALEKAMSHLRED